MSSEARMFLESLFAFKPAGLYLLLCLTDDEEPIWYDDLENAIECAEPISDCDVFVSVGLAKQNYGPGRRCPSGEVAGIVGVYANIDLRSDAHARDALPRNVEQALSILPAEMPPSFVIFTGDGIQAGWLFPETWVFENDDERCRAATLLNRWNILLKENAGQRGWTFERLTDLSAILRVPGSSNCNDSSNPTRVTIHSQNEPRYTALDLTQYLDDLAVPDPDTDLLADQASAELEGASLTINLSARIPDERLQAWLESDPKFKNTWFRHRDDFSDQAQEKYDLALASFAFGIGCTDQDVVTLIVHHRFMHRQKARTALDYFRRTLAKADKSPSLKVLAVDPPGSGTNGEPTPSAPGPPTEPAAPALSPERVRIGLCHEISSVLGVEVLRLVKLAGQVPSYRLELAKGKIEFPNVSKLIHQNAVGNGIAGMTGVLMPRFKAKEWRGVAQKLLSACIEEQGSDELYSEGAVRLHIDQYLHEVGFILSIEGELAQNIHRPMVRHKRITVCLGDLRMNINKTTQPIVSPQALAAMLSAVGAKTVRVRGKGFREQIRWELPLEEFDPSDYSAPDSEDPVD
jgi:hypothetical protein